MNGRGVSKTIVCVKTGEPSTKDVQIGRLVIRGQMDFIQLRRCLACDNEACLKKVFGGKGERRRGMVSEYGIPEEEW